MESCIPGPDISSASTNETNELTELQSMGDYTSQSLLRSARLALLTEPFLLDVSTADLLLCIGSKANDEDCLDSVEVLHVNHDNSRF